MRALTPHRLATAGLLAATLLATGLLPTAAAAPDLSLSDAILVGALARRDDDADARGRLVLADDTCDHAIPLFGLRAPTLDQRETRQFDRLMTRLAGALNDTDDLRERAERLLRGADRLSAVDRLDQASVLRHCRDTLDARELVLERCENGATARCRDTLAAIGLLATGALSDKTAILLLEAVERERDRSRGSSIWSLD